MEFEKFIAISGQGSLFVIISRTANGLIAESVEDKKRIPVFQNMDVSSLQDISIYTNSGEVPLKEVFLKMFEKEEGKEAIDAKADNNSLFSYFETIVPEFDREKVYASHIKKMLKWYNQLVKSNLLDPEKLKAKEENTEVAESKKSEEKPKVEKEKKEPKKVAKTNVTKPAAPKNAPTKKVQGVRKAGGS
jgi:hypothetical protein